MNIPSLKNTVSSEEWQTRVDLAALYRLTAMYGWSDLVFTHISARIPGPEHHFLINPYGMLFDEITASSLVKVDQNCNKLQESPFPVNPAGFTIHSSIHDARADVNCIIHTHSRAGVAVSAQKQGILRISQQSTFILASLAYHDYEGVALRDDEKPRLQEDLGDKTFFMLRNHGLLTVGKTMADTFLGHYMFENTCQIQLAAQSGGDLVEISEEVQQDVGKILAASTAALGGQIAWPALLRKLDKVDDSYKN